MRGMIRKVLHLVSVEEVAAAAAAKPKAPAAKTAASAPKKGKS
jgi:hypothetical protein